MISPLNADEIDSAGDNLSVESDSRANQRNETEVLLQQRYYSEKQFHRNKRSEGSVRCYSRDEN